MYANFQAKRTTLTFSTQVCPKMDFGVGISKIDLNLGKLFDYVEYFGSNNIEGIAESWVEAAMS